MDHAVRERIKDSIVCGRYPDLQDIIDFWNFVEKDDVKLAFFKTEETSLDSIEEINQKIESSKDVQEHILQTKSFLSEIRCPLPVSLAFSLKRAKDKLALAFYYAESWEKNLIAAKHDLN